MAYFIIFICRGFSSGSQAVNRGGGWLGNVHGNQHGMHKPPEQGGCSQAGENNYDGSFHRSITLAPRMSNGETRQGVQM